MRDSSSVAIWSTGIGCRISLLDRVSFCSGIVGEWLSDGLARMNARIRELAWQERPHQSLLWLPPAGRHPIGRPFNHPRVKNMKIMSERYFVLGCHSTPPDFSGQQILLDILGG